MTLPPFAARKGKRFEVTTLAAVGGRSFLQALQVLPTPPFLIRLDGAVELPGEDVVGRLGFKSGQDPQVVVRSLPFLSRGAYAVEGSPVLFGGSGGSRRRSR